MVVWQIDDDPVHTELVEMIIRRTGFSNDTRSFHSARAALKALDQSLPDLILLDLRMPDMDGWEFIELTRSRKMPPIVIVTSSIDAREKKRALEIPAVRGWIEKPVRVEDIVDLAVD